MSDTPDILKNAYRGYNSKTVPSAWFDYHETIKLVERLTQSVIIHKREIQAQSNLMRIWGFPTVEYVKEHSFHEAWIKESSNDS